MSELAKISIIIPCFNEERTILSLLEAVANADTLGLKKEVIVVDDGSTDKTAALIKESPLVNIIVTNDKNRGKGFSIREGLNLSTGDIIIIQDADLEYSPSDYTKLLEPIIKGESNVVYGARSRTNLNKNLLTYVAKVCFTGMVNTLYRVDLTDLNTCYKVFKRDLIQRLPLKSNRFGFCSEVTTMVILEGEKITEVPVSYNPRDKSQGKKIGLIDGFSLIFPILYNRLFFNNKSVKVERIDEV